MAASRQEVFERVKEVLVEQLGVDEDADHRRGFIPGGPRRGLARPRGADHGARGSVRDQDLRRGRAEDHDRGAGRRLRLEASGERTTTAALTRLIDGLPPALAGVPVFRHIRVGSTTGRKSRPSEQPRVPRRRVLELAVAECAVRPRHPDFPEGRLTKAARRTSSRAASCSRRGPGSSVSTSACRARAECGSRTTQSGSEDSERRRRSPRGRRSPPCFLECTARRRSKAGDASRRSPSGSRPSVSSPCRTRVRPPRRSLPGRTRPAARRPRLSLVDSRGRRTTAASPASRWWTAGRSVADRDGRRRTPSRKPRSRRSQRSGSPRTRGGVRAAR